MSLDITTDLGGHGQGNVASILSRKMFIFRYFYFDYRDVIIKQSISVSKRTGLDITTDLGGHNHGQGNAASILTRKNVYFSILLFRLQGCNHKTKHFGVETNWR
jgi:hypothetical protein